MRDIGCYLSFAAAQTASFSRKILALWRMSTGSDAVNQEGRECVAVSGLAAASCASSVEQLLRASAAARTACRASGSTTITGFCRPGCPRRPAPSDRRPDAD